MMMPFDLVSNIGGNLGLFVGMSILSMCEVVQFVVELFALMVFGQKRKKENKTDPMWQHHTLLKRVSLKSKECISCTRSHKVVTDFITKNIPFKEQSLEMYSPASCVIALEFCKKT